MIALVDVGSIIALALVVALVAWGLWPSASATSTPPQPAPGPNEPSGTDTRKVGVVVGMMGGSIHDAAVVNYALSRQDHPPTNYEIGVTAGIQKAIGDSGEQSGS